MPKKTNLSQQQKNELSKLIFSASIEFCKVFLHLLYEEDDDKLIHIEIDTMDQANTADKEELTAKSQSHFQSTFQEFISDINNTKNQINTIISNSKGKNLPPKLQAELNKLTLSFINSTPAQDPKLFIIARVVLSKKYDEKIIRDYLEEISKTQNNKNQNNKKSLTMDLMREKIEKSQKEKHIKQKESEDYKKQKQDDKKANKEKENIEIPTGKTSLQESLKEQEKITAEHENDLKKFEAHRKNNEKTKRQKDKEDQIKRSKEKEEIIKTKIAEEKISTSKNAQSQFATKEIITENSHLEKNDHSNLNLFSDEKLSNIECKMDDIDVISTGLNSSDSLNSKNTENIDHQETMEASQDTNPTIIGAPQKYTDFLAAP